MFSVSGFKVIEQLKVTLIYTNYQFIQQSAVSTLHPNSDETAHIIHTLIHTSILHEITPKPNQY